MAPSLPVLTGVGSLSNCDNEEEGPLIPFHFIESTNSSQPQGLRGGD